MIDITEKDLEITSYNQVKKEMSRVTIKNLLNKKEIIVLNKIDLLDKKMEINEIVNLLFQKIKIVKYITFIYYLIKNQCFKNQRQSCYHMFLKNSKIIVIKIGSSLLIDKNKKIRKKWLYEFSKDIKESIKL